MPRFSRPLVLGLVVAPFLTAPLVYGVQSNATVFGTPTGLNSSYSNLDAASGLLTGDTDAGTPFGDSGLNPFNPPFQNTQMVIVQPAANTTGSIVFKLDQPVAGDGKIGVFSNTGISNVGASVPTAGSPPDVLGQPSMASVKVSSDGITYVPLFKGGVQTFDGPTNYYLDAPVTLDPTFGFAEQGLGTQIANQFQPFHVLDSTAAPDPAHDPLSLFSGLTYDQMLSLLNGSAGGTWFDLVGSGLSSIQYIEFDVPTGDRLAIDSISAVPEPVSLSALGLIGVLSLRRRR